jgi:tight adherence protein C
MSVPLTVWLSAAAVMTSIGLTWFVISGRRAGLSPRQLLFDSPSTSVRELTLDRNAFERLATGFLDRIRRVGTRLTPVSVAKDTVGRIAQAGLSERWTADRFIAMKALFALTVFLALFLIALGNGAASLLLVAIGAAVVAFFVPDLILVRKGEARGQVMRDQLADIADQILIAVEAGASLDTAIDRVTRTSDGPLQSEFRRTLQDISFGLSRKEALTAMVARTSVSELRELLLAIAQSEEHGLSIGRILRVQTAEIRDKRKSRAEEAAMKVPVKIVFPLILCILPCLLAVILGPAVVQVARNINF